MLDQLHFKYPMEDERNKQILLQCFVATEDAEYIVKEINLQTAGGGTSGATWVEYVCDLNVNPLKSETIDNFAPGSTTADASANLALAGTGWSVGYCDVTKQRTAAGTNCSPFDCLGDIAKAYSCDITFDTTHKLVNLHQQQGADRGAYLAEQLNLKTLQVQSNSRDYCTRLYPIGKDGLTIADVNGGVPYVSNYQYSTEVIVKRWTDNRYTIAADLMADAQDRLAYLSKPTRAYSASIVDLARVSDKWELLDFQIGDTITLLSYSAGVREQQRIVKIDRYLDESEKSTCEISNKIASLDDIVLRVSDAADAVDAATDSTGTIMGSSVQVTNPDGTYTTLTAAMATVGELIATKATITDLQAATARITTLEATSVTTTYLTANYLTADAVKATYATIDNLSAATARISTLESNQITTTYLNAHYASIDLSNIGTGIIQTAMIATGAVQTAQIADGSITDAKIVGLTANKITAGTIDASKITVTNLNCANLTVGTINGQQIASGAIDTSKLTSSLNSTISTAASNASSALSAASAAQSTANGKNTAYYQASAPSGGAYKVNDVWYDTDDGYKMYYYSGSAWTAAALGNDAIATLDAGKITTGYLAAARIAASTITGTMIAGTTITAANIAVSTITATQIAAGTITATQIASRTITADRIVAGAITANEMASHTITATQIAANTITAGQIAAGTITATQIASGAITSTQINVTNLISALNVSTQTLYAQRLTTSAASIYGTIGSFTDYGSSGTYTAQGIGLYDSSGIECGSIAVKNVGTDATGKNTYDITLSSQKYKNYASSSTLSYSSLHMYGGLYEFNAQYVDSDTGTIIPFYLLMGAQYGGMYSLNAAGWENFIGKVNSTDTVSKYRIYYGGDGDTNRKLEILSDGTVNTFGTLNIRNSSGTIVAYIDSDGIVNGTTGFRNTTKGVWAIDQSSTTNEWVNNIGFSAGLNQMYMDTYYGRAYFNAVGASDERLKSGIAPSTVDALGKIRSIQRVQYTLISSGKYYADGVSAQQLTAVDTDYVCRCLTDAAGIDYYGPCWDRIMPDLIGAVQQTAIRDDCQDNEIALLNAQIVALQARIAALEAAA